MRPGVSKRAKLSAHLGESASILPPALTTDAVKQQLERILDSDLFKRAERLSGFLRYVVEQTLQGKAAGLKEYSIALAVYERSDDFDSRLDPIVRVEAGRLRAKIREYYDTVGANDPIRIGLAKRGYRPVFEPQKQPSRGKAAQRDETAQLDNDPAHPAGKTAARRNDVVTIAVLPFADLSPDESQHYFCEGLADTIISALTKVSTLRVSSRTSVRRFKDNPMDVREVGRQLKVDCVLEGSVQRIDTSVRVNIQLSSAANGLDLWGDTFDRPLEDVFEIQDDITQSVVEGLREALSPKGENAERSTKKRASNNKTGMKAYNEYLKGLYHWNKRTESEVRKSIECFEGCIGKDPDYAPAYAGLSACYITLGISSAAQPEEIMPKALAAASKALELDPQLAKAKACTAMVKALHQWDWTGARRAFQEALQLNPRNATAHHWYAIGYLAPQGDLRAALETMERAREINAASVIINTHLGLVHYFKREYRRAIRQFELAIELEPSFYRAYWELGRTYVQDCNLGDAVKAFEKARELTNGMFRTGALGHCYGFLRRREEARDVLKGLMDRRKNGDASAYEIAEVYLGLQDYDRMFEWLDEARKERSPWLIWIGVDPIFDGVRADSRFVALLRAVGLKTSQ